MNREQAEVISDGECQLLIMSMLASRGDAPITEDEALKVINWATDARFSNMMLGLVLSGKVNIDWNGKEVTFNAKS